MLTAALARDAGCAGAASAATQADSTHASARTERLALQAADAYWSQRGLTACAHPRIEYASLAKRASADAFVGPNLAAAYCVIRMSSRLHMARARRVRSTSAGRSCTSAGTRRGCEHASTGIMRSDGGDRPPAACTRLFGKR